MLTLLVINEYGAHLLQRCKERFQLAHLVSSSTLTTLFGIYLIRNGSSQIHNLKFKGILAGLLLNLLPDKQMVIGQIESGFSQLFLVVLLPPILYEGAINMEKVSNSCLTIQNF
jgi:sodium/hydrogen exchanger 8